MNATTCPTTRPTPGSTRRPLRAQVLRAASLAVAALALGVGCAAPASVEGVFANESFTLTSEAPLSKPTGSGRDMVVVLSQIDGETLRTVSLLLPDIAKLPLGTPLEAGTGAYADRRPSLEVSAGALVVETRADGVEIISSDDPVTAGSTRGTFTLDERSDDLLAGTFQVDLDDGGFLAGSFVATPAGR